MFFFKSHEELQQRTSTELRDFAVALEKGEAEDGEKNDFQLPEQNGEGKIIRWQIHGIGIFTYMNGWYLW